MAGRVGGAGSTGLNGAPEAEPREQEAVAPAGASVSEEVVWRARAVRAETQLESLERRVSELEEELVTTRSESSRLEQRRALELELALAEAQDIETAALVAESIMSRSDEPDIRAAVAELRASKPFLFRPRPATGAMSGRVARPPVGHQLDELAEEARDSGDRGALLRYLRARRTN